MRGKKRVGCVVDECKGDHFGRGLCKTHYHKARHRGLFTKLICSVEQCKSPGILKGFCVKHYARVRRHGDPNIVLPSYKNMTSRIMSKKKFNFVPVIEPEDKTNISLDDLERMGMYGTSNL